MYSVRFAVASSQWCILISTHGAVFRFVWKSQFSLRVLFQCRNRIWYFPWNLLSMAHVLEEIIIHLLGSGTFCLEISFIVVSSSYTGGGSHVLLSSVVAPISIVPTNWLMDTVRRGQRMGNILPISAPPAILTSFYQPAPSKLTSSTEVVSMLGTAYRSLFFTVPHLSTDILPSGSDQSTMATWQSIDARSKVVGLGLLCSSFVLHFESFPFRPLMGSLPRIRPWLERWDRVRILQFGFRDAVVLFALWWSSGLWRFF